MFIAGIADAEPNLILIMIIYDDNDMVAVTRFNTGMHDVDNCRGDLHPWATCTLGRPAPFRDLHPWATMLVMKMLTMNGDDVSVCL